MIKYIYEINPNHCTKRLIDALQETVEYVERERMEYITPEHLLHTIIQQPEFGRYAENKGIDMAGMESELERYFTQLGRIPDDEDFSFTGSLSFIALTVMLQKQCIASIDKDSLPEHIVVKNGDLATAPGYKGEVEPENILLTDDVRTLFPLTVPSVLNIIGFLENSYAAYMIGKYITESSDTWIQDIDGQYLDDFMEYLTDESNLGGLSSDDEEEDSGEEEYDDDDFFSHVMSRAHNLMGAINHLNSIKDELHNINGEKPNTDRQPWENLVTDIMETYKTKNPLIGRERELSRAVRVLCRKDKNNLLFIGDPGVGKTALIYGLARLIAEGNVPKWLTGQHIYALDMASIVAGTNYHGEFEKRMKTILEGAREKGSCILYIDEIHSIMGSGQGGNSVNAADILKPYLEDGTVRFIGCTTYQEYNRHMANDKAIVRRFQQIDIKEPTTDEAVEIVRGLQKSYEQHHGVRYNDDAVRYAVEQSARLIHDRFLPDKALDIIDEAGAWLQQNPQLNKKGEPKAERFQKVGIDIVKKILTDVCRIDAKALSAADADTSLKDLDRRIASDIYGQDAAIRQVVQAVMMSKAGLTEPDKPIASLLFVGPTGVGKTEVCRVLAREMGIELVRFDMSEYTEKHTISKLIGSPAGYVGYDEGGLLTDAIRKTPNCVLLLDEIEKAHTDIYNILLQVMDYARLTDNKGNKIDFKNVILIMTSNAGAQHAGQAAIGFARGQTKGQAMLAAVKKAFKPEFINRLSATVVFNDMDRHMASLILEKKLRQLSQRLSQRNVSLCLSDEARAFLIERGYNPQYGAREMDRAIQQHLTPVLMNEILFGSLKNGGTAKVVTDGEELKLKSLAGNEK